MILKNTIRYRIIFLAFLTLTGSITLAQKRPANILRGIGDRIPGMGNQSGSTGTGGDSVIARNRYEDSITVTIYYLDSTRGHKPDTIINDFTTRYPIPATHIYLGNTGVATRSIIYQPELKPGFDPGLHALDVYKWKLEKAKFYNTTRPYTELGYVLGSRAEQMIEVIHTQNIRPSWNFSFNYRLINSPGTFRNQKTNHNNYLFTSWYQGRKKRYNNYFVILGNKLQAGESGGISNDQDYLNDIIYAKDRYIIPSKLGGSPAYITNFFTTTMYTGNRYNEFNVLMRQQYDVGRKDSLLVDSTMVPLFFPKLRFEHSFNYGKYNYTYQDFPVQNNNQENRPDPAYYATNYNYTIPQSGSVNFRDKWREISNDFSIYQFPDSKNQHQFIKVGLQLQLLNGLFIDSVESGSAALYNLAAHGEYRNRTKNQKWDLLAQGRLYMNGYNAGDYRAYASLQRFISKNIGSLQLGFENVNRSPSFIYDQRSAFYLDAPENFNKENTTHLFANLFQPQLKLQLGADYYLVSNYLYLNGFYQLEQESALFNVLRINAKKTFKIGRRWNWHSELYVQQKTGGAQLNLPAVFTRNRILYEGNLGFPNLKIAFGLEGRYHSPYKADSYSPVLGQFFYQDSIRISNLPDVAALIHFKIRSFKAWFRAENLNTARLFGGFQFNNNNLAAPDYPTPGLVIRLGIYWGFVN